MLNCSLQEIPRIQVGTPTCHCIGNSKKVGRQLGTTVVHASPFNLASGEKRIAISCQLRCMEQGSKYEQKRVPTPMAFPRPCALAPQEGLSCATRSGRGIAEIWNNHVHWLQHTSLLPIWLANVSRCGTRFRPQSHRAFFNFGIRAQSQTSRFGALLLLFTLAS
jgi:hypothetical protein